MNIIKKIVLLCLVLAMVPVSFATSSPVPMLEHTADQIIASLKQNKSSLKKDHRIIYHTVEQYLLPHVDVNGMARSVLGREAWNKANAAERQEFTRAFTQLVIRTYSNPLAEYTDEKVKFSPLRTPLDEKFARVNSVIVRPSGQNIPLSYSLVSKSGSWKIYDLSVEGVSLLQSFRSQFSGMLQNSNLKAVISEMRKNSQAA